MDLKFKKPSKETQKVMSQIAIGEDCNDYFKIAEDKLCDLTNHTECKLVNSGNAAILTAMGGIEGDILVPNQGAWNGFKQIAKFLNKEIITLDTKYGLFEKDSLKESLELCEISSDTQNALFITSFAGYAAEQNIKEISKICHDNDILVVEDASGGIGDSKSNLANGNYSDIIIGSTGSPKIVNVGYGGFITTNNSSVFDKSKLILKTSKINDIAAGGIATELDFAKNTLNKTINACNYIKSNLNNVIHENKRGINIILESDDKSFSFNLRNQLKLDSHGMITKCPNYNRIKVKGVAIEIKNLDISCLEKEYLDFIIDTIANYQ